MKLRTAIFCVIFSWALGSVGARGAAAMDEWIDRLDEALTASSADGRMRGRLSGTLDLEGFRFSQPEPGLIVASGETLFSPRLTLFLDAQLGSRAYFFAQGRLDRGFDPTDGGAEGRLDEYALRLTPWSDGRLNVQVGKFATIVGTWVHRHGSWDNPFVTAPLAYEHLTGMWDVAAVRNAATLWRWAHVTPKSYPGEEFADSRFRLPIVWGPSYATGAAVSGELGRFNYAVEVKNGSLSSRPEYWSADQVRWSHPTYSGRIGWRPSERWSLGASASAGAYLLPSARSTLASGFDLDDYRQRVLAQDVSYAWHHWQVWAEVFESRFEIPTVGTVRTVAWYLETKYKFTPQFFGAVRWNRQVFGTLSDSAGRRLPWGYDTWRVDLAPTYRFTPHVQIKLQYSVEPEYVVKRSYNHTVAAQFTVRF